MDDRSKHIDDLFREGLNDYRETPPASVWTSLEQRLPAAEATVAEQPSRRWLWILLLLALLGIVGYFIINKSLEKTTSKRKPLNENVERSAPSGATPSTTATDTNITEAGTPSSSNDGTETAMNGTPDAPGTSKSETRGTKKKQAVKVWDALPQDIRRVAHPEAAE